MLVKIYIENTQKSPSVRCGSYGYIFTCETSKRLVKREGYDWNEGTKNQLDLEALVLALCQFTKPAELEIYGDLQWVAVQSRYIDTWKKNGWKTAAGRDVKHKKLWQQLSEFMEGHDIRFIQCKEHEYTKDLLSVIGKGGTGIYGQNERKG